MAESGQTGKLPGVSVIVPVYNDQEHIGRLIESLLGQDYPAELVEIIVVDNNSADSTRQIVQRHPVRLLDENNIQSSYAARNRGIKAAKNEILAFIDSDCTARTQWIREGVNTLLAASADLVGGKVEFVFSDKKTNAEIYDSITHMNVKANVEEDRYAPTANLFVKSKLFEKIGMFPAWVRSGGDFQWTHQAIQSGFSLVYAPQAIVNHPTRSLGALLRKRFRMGPGIMHAQIQQGKPRWGVIARLLLTLPLPVPPNVISNAITRSGQAHLKKKFLQLWVIACLCKLAGRAGVLAELLGLTGQRAPKKPSL